ncbi:MAG TPA: DUF4384 domain-containing protein [Kofleriaceae bacterium]|nr:DUF4384 domain-containing protein [Kofleriaceae bacterium]
MHRYIPIALCAVSCGGAQDGHAPGKLFVELHVQAMVQGDAMARSVRVGDTLQSGDRVELWVVPSEDAYVSVLQVGADNKLAPLYPPGKLTAGKSTRLPPSGFFELDQNVGEETVVLIASRTPISESDPAAAALVERARAGGSAEKRDRCVWAPPAATAPPPATVPEGTGGAGSTVKVRTRSDQVVLLGGVPIRGLEDVPAVAAQPIDADTAREARPATIDENGKPVHAGAPAGSEGSTAITGRGLLAARGLTYVPAADSGTVIEADPKGVAIAEFSFCHAPR